MPPAEHVPCRPRCHGVSIEIAGRPLRHREPLRPTDPPSRAPAVASPSVAALLDYPRAVSAERPVRRPGWWRRSPRAPLPLTALLSAALVFAASSALADARTEARAHFKKGMEAIGNGHYDEGIVELQRAYDILPHPNVLYNIARAYAEEGELEPCVENYKRYLEGNPTDRDEVAEIVAKPRGAPHAAAGGGPSGASRRPADARHGTEHGWRRARAARCAHRYRAPPVAPPPPSAPELGQARTEDVFEETVVTASKGAQSPLDAPNSTSIITEQDVRLSGITKSRSFSGAWRASKSWR